MSRRGATGASLAALLAMGCGTEAPPPAMHGWVETDGADMIVWDSDLAIDDACAPSPEGAEPAGHDATEEVLAAAARRTTIVVDPDGALRASVDASGVVDAPLRHRLRSGLPQALVTRLAFQDPTTGEHVARGRHACCVVYDAWRGRWGVRVGSGASARAAWRSTSSLDRVVDACLRPAGVLLVPTGAGRASHGASLVALVDVNPLSREALARLRSWLAARPGEPTRDEAFYGGSVGRLVGERIARAERSFERRFEVAVPPAR